MSLFVTENSSLHVVDTVTFDLVLLPFGLGLFRVGGDRGAGQRGGGRGQE